MKTASRLHTYDYHSAQNSPQFSVKPEEIFMAETELCSGGWLLSPQDTWTPDKTCALNPTVCVAVDGARPGDLLIVDILDIVPDRFGYTGFTAFSNPLANKIRSHSWGLNTRTLKISEEGIHWNERLVLPLCPMIGTLGTAPAAEALSNAKAGSHGGNMDVQEVCIGSRVYLPVETHGALLHIGDVHALQGDGEINCSGGIECRSVVTLKASLAARPPSFQCVRIENEEYIMTVGSEKSLEESFCKATDQLLCWMEEDWGIPLADGHLLLGQVLEARCTQFVNPTHSYVCKISKKILDAY